MGESIREQFDNEPVECCYYHLTDIVVAKLLSAIDTRSRAIVSAVAEYIRTYLEKKKSGGRMDCLACKQELSDERRPAGFVLMIRTIDGGFDAEQANCLVGAVCTKCDEEMGGSEDKILDKAMPPGTKMVLTAGSKTVQ